MAANRIRKVSVLSGSVALVITTFAATPAYAQPTPDTLVSVCSGVSLPPSVVTGHV